MRPVSSRFLAALRCSHTARYRVRLLTTFQTGATPSGAEVDIITGSVTLDGTANERGSLDLTVSPGCPGDWPENQFSPLTPFGNEVFVERGIAGLVQPPTIGSLPAGVIVGWPASAGAIPQGWSRVTELDDRYLKGVPNNSTDPGTTGGAASHSHTPTGHDHTAGSHTHGDGASTGPNLTVTGTSGSFPRSRSTHNHAVTINASSDDTGSSSPSTNAVDNDPANEAVIWIVSNGTTNGIPSGAISWFDDTSFPSGWSQHATGNARFLKGASSGGNGGGTGGANTHTHSGSHTHTNNHTHDFDTPTEDDTLPIDMNSSGTGVRVVEVHDHAVNVASGGVNTASDDLAFSTDSNEPDFYTLALGENVSSGEDLPTGVIAVWRGPLGSIPAGWVLCDGNNGTPDLTGSFIKNATTPATDVGNTGGSADHSHTGSNHNHSVSSHSHTISYTALLGGGIRSTAGGVTVASDLHGHNSHASASATGTTGNAAPAAPTEDHEPPYYEVAFIQLQGTPPDPITPDAEPEYVPLGYFRIETIEQDDAPRSPIRITARDRMAAIIEARMLEPRTFAAGTTFLEVFEDLVLEVYPSAVLDIDDAVAGSTLREPATVEEDRYAFLRDMATSRGRVMFFDHRGVLVVAPEPDSDTPVFTVDEGADGVLVNVRRQLSRAGVYNAVVAEGVEADYDNEEPPARAVVWDDNPNSATYFFGPFGRVPRFYASPFIFTDAQAESAAASILARTIGIPYTLDITAIPNPALEPLDPITVIFEAGRQEIHVIDVITIPLTSDQPMVISSRSLVQFIAGQEGS